ncbi:MAG: PAS domain S-box protein [Terriglobia bacterium]
MSRGGRGTIGLRRAWLGYGIAVVATAALLGARFALGFRTGDSPALILFLFPVMLSAYVGGLGPGLVATVLGALGASYFFLAPLHSFRITGVVQSAQWIRLVLSGSVISLLYEALHRQIAKRHKTEEKLEASEEQLAAILSSAMDGIITIDEQQRITFFNPAAERMFKSPAAGAIGQPLDRFIPERFRVEHANQIRAFGQTRTTQRTMGKPRSVHGFRSGGEEFPIEASISQAEVAGQKLFTVILRDVTERERIAAAERQQAALLDQTYDAVFVWNINGEITFWNRGAERLYGYPRAEALDHVCHDLLQTTLPGGVEEFRRVLQRDGQWEGELQHRTRDGRWITGDSRLSMIRHEEGGVVLEIVRDITEAKRAAAELEAANDLLEQRVADRTAELETANKELEAFTYSVSHDLRAPLRHIDGFSKLLVEQHRAELSPDAQEYLATIRDAVLQMGMLIDDLLNLARVGRRPLSMVMTGLDSLAEQVSADLVRANPGREIEWKIDTLPFVECDPMLMKQVFVNLLANAVKFTRLRNPAVIEVGVTEQDGARAVYVRDNGVGFSMKYSSKLFGVFQRLHRSEDFEGTGVGLATVQRIIHKHGGRVWAQAELDKGATFYFTLHPPDEPAAGAEGARPI